MSYGGIGRRPLSQSERRFRRLVQAFEERFKVQAELLVRIATSFDQKTLIPLQSLTSTIRNLQSSHSALYEKLDKIYKRVIGSTEIRQCDSIKSTDMTKYRSKMDPQYWVNQLLKQQQKQTIVHSKDVILLQLFYLYQISVVSQDFLKWFSDNFGTLLGLLREGESEKFMNISHYDVAKLIAHFGSLLIKNQKVSVEFDI